jgi:hypothetical protein
MHGRQQGTVQSASQDRNKAKVQNIFVISPHNALSGVTALFTMLLFHLLLPSSSSVKLGARWAAFGKYKFVKECGFQIVSPVLYCDNHFGFNHLSVQVI